MEHIPTRRILPDMRLLTKNFLSAAAGLCLAVPLSGFGATVNVSVVNFAFVPATTSINVGDTVLWTWPTGSNFHNVTSTSLPQVWPASATLNGPATFSNQFTTAGAFPYECTVHLFTGQIIVCGRRFAAEHLNHESRARRMFSEPANVTIQATASDPNSGGSVTNVQFLVGTTVVTNETAASSLPSPFI